LSSSETPQPTVTVVVVNWNRREMLRASLESIRAQKDTTFEIVLVDNGSTDGSVEMARAEFGPAGLTIVENPDNRGFCAANNQGIALARGEFVALLNNDAEADPAWLSSLLTAFRGRPEIGMAASKIVDWDNPRVIDKVGHQMYPDGQNRGRGSGQIDRGQFDQVEEVLWPDGCACMYRSAMLRQIGGFDEDFFAYADDAELGLRARIAGWGCLYIPGAVVRHRRGSTLGVASPARIELIERNRVLLAAKLFPGSLLWLNGAYYLARIAAGALAGARGRGEVRRFQGPWAKLGLAFSLIRADLRAIPMLPGMLRKRRALESIRKLTPRQTRELLMRHRIGLKELTEQAL
jgi:GT2 family glycosyltransferase